MRAGNLRKRLSIQRRTLTSDAQGGVNQTWATIGTCWANVEPLGGAERAQYAQVYPTLSAQITIRYQPGISTKMRLTFLGPPDTYGSMFYGAGTYGASAIHTWEILDVQDPEERHIQLVLMCEELGVLVA